MRSLLPRILWSHLRSNHALHVVWCFSGIVGSLVVYGILQERIMQRPFGGEAFTHSLVLVLANRVVTCALALALSLYHGYPLAPQAPLASFAAVSLSNVSATFCQYEALRHVSFAAQTLGKSAKMLPVMVWGAVLGGKRYSAWDYARAAAVAAGCAAFLASGSGPDAAGRAGHSSTLAGLALLAGYLGVDGFTAAWQDRLFATHAPPMPNQVLYVTACSALASAAALAVTGGLGAALVFLAAHPEAAAAMTTLSLAATVGQLFITHTIQTHGALLFAMASTTRQFLSVLLSGVLYGHRFSSGQYAGAALVFGALFHKTLYGRRAGTGIKRGVEAPADRKTR